MSVTFSYLRHTEIQGCIKGSEPLKDV